MSSIGWSLCARLRALLCIIATARRFYSSGNKASERLRNRRKGADLIKGEAVRTGNPMLTVQGSYYKDQRHSFILPLLRKTFLASPTLTTFAKHLSLTYCLAIYYLFVCYSSIPLVGKFCESRDLHSRAYNCVWSCASWANLLSEWLKRAAWYLCEEEVCSIFHPSKIALKFWWPNCWPSLWWMCSVTMTLFGKICSCLFLSILAETLKLNK